MNLDWKAPFQFAWELALYLTGSILILFILFVATLMIFGLVRAFFIALKKARASSKEQPKAKKPSLKSVE
jgi:flagellar basal body-associated protein FliL